MKVLKFFIAIFFTIILIEVAYISYNKIDFKYKTNIGKKEKEEVLTIKLYEDKDYIYDASYTYDLKDQEINYNNNENLIIDNEFKNNYIKNGIINYNDLKVPYININSGEVNIINSQIQDIYKKYSKYFDECTINNDCKILLNYYSYVSKDIISVVIEYGYSKDNLTPKYITYNFDINTGYLMDYNNYLNKYNIENSTIESSIKEYINDDNIYNSTINNYNNLFKDNKIPFFIEDNNLNIILDINNMPRVIKINK